jgi:hypothetical protein
MVDHGDGLIAAMDVTLDACAGYSKCGSGIYRYTLDITNTIGLSHYVWDQLHCDVPWLDSQRDRDAITRVVWTRLTYVQKENALTRLRPEGKRSTTPRPVRIYRGNCVWTQGAPARCIRMRGGVASASELSRLRPKRLVRPVHPDALFFS